MPPVFLDWEIYKLMVTDSTCKAFTVSPVLHSKLLGGWVVLLHKGYGGYMAVNAIYRLEGSSQYARFPHRETKAPVGVT